MTSQYIVNTYLVSFFSLHLLVHEVMVRYKNCEIFNSILLFTRNSVYNSQGWFVQKPDTSLGRVAQWIEQLPSKQSVAGSNPAALVLIQYSSSMLVTKDI